MFCWVVAIIVNPMLLCFCSFRTCRAAALMSCGAFSACSASCKFVFTGLSLSPSPAPPPLHPRPFLSVSHGCFSFTHSPISNHRHALIRSGITHDRGLPCDCLKIFTVIEDCSLLWTGPALVCTAIGKKILNTKYHHSCIQIMKKDFDTHNRAKNH